MSTRRQFKIGDIVTISDGRTGRVIMDLGGDMYRLRLPRCEASIRTVNLRPASDRDAAKYRKATGS